MTNGQTVRPFCIAMGTAYALVACSPTVKVAAPDKPIEINMNVKIEHEIRVKIEKDVEELVSKNKDLF